MYFDELKNLLKGDMAMEGDMKYDNGRRYKVSTYN